MTRLDADPEKPERRLAALQYRDFRLLLIGEVTSAIGTEMLYVALSWQMYLLTHSALALGLLGLAGFIPALLFSLLGGNFADAHNRKKILYVTQPIFMLCSTLLALATFYPCYHTSYYVHHRRACRGNACIRPSRTKFFDTQFSSEEGFYQYPECL